MWARNKNRVSSFPFVEEFMGLKRCFQLFCFGGNGCSTYFRPLRSCCRRFRPTDEGGESSEHRRDSRVWTRRPRDRDPITSGASALANVLRYEHRNGSWKGRNRASDEKGSFKSKKEGFQKINIIYFICR